MPSTDDLWGIRVKVAGNIFRLLGFFDGKKLVVLSHAFHKKTAISRIENHTADIKLSTIEKFAEAVGKRLTLKIA